jgi:hypothetical protein
MIDALRPNAVASWQAHRLTITTVVSASHAARCVACHGVASELVPVALVIECSMPLVSNVARQPRLS